MKEAANVLRLSGVAEMGAAAYKLSGHGCVTWRRFKRKVQGRPRRRTPLTDPTGSGVNRWKTIPPELEPAVIV